MSGVLRNPDALRRVIGEYGELCRLEGCTPQVRGQRLNALIADALKCWGIGAVPNDRSAGEVDVAFAIDGVRYILEAKWEQERTDTGKIAKLQKRVRQRLAGTYGVMLSMSGYSPAALDDVKDGDRLEVLLLDQGHWEAILDGLISPDKLFSLVRDHAAYHGRAYTQVPELLSSAARMPRSQGEAGADRVFVGLYRSQVCALHGFLEPPDFERADRVHAADLYVPTQEIREVPGPGRPQPASGRAAARLSVADLPRLVSRTVLLGDPGGGKSTAARMLMHSCASDPAARTPFLVSLGRYAAKAAPGRSIVEYIEQDLPGTYECRPPHGLVDRLLRAGSAMVIFDGLDEFLDAPGRRGLSRRIEMFCNAYPLAPVLITSRDIGYQRARVDSGQFTVYRLQELSQTEVSEYAHKWFSESAAAAAFLSDSGHIDDLRSNPLLLSLMCSLYREDPALPVSRAALYERCADLLLRTWDEERGIRRTLPARVPVRPLIRHLAWWLSSQRLPVVREARLLGETVRFLQARGLDADDARDAAEEFAEFCRERTWVLSQGITAKGEKGYGFTHRTFLEYYAAAYIVTRLHATPVDLAEFLARQIGDESWSAIDLLAVSVMEQATEGTADRVCEILLERGSDATERGKLLWFLTWLLDIAPPSPATVRGLIRKILQHRIKYDSETEALHPLNHLTSRRAGRAHQDLFRDEVSSYVRSAVASGNPQASAEALRLLLELGDRAQPERWREWADGLARRHSAEITAASAHSIELRSTALYAGIITLEQALAMPGGLGPLMQPIPQMLQSMLTSPYPANLYLMVTTSSYVEAEAFSAIGRYVISHPLLPLMRASDYDFGLADIADEETLREHGARLDEMAGLGLAVVHAICSEVFGWHGERPRADLPMPPQFKRTFRDWTDGKLDFAHAQ